MSKDTIDRLAQALADSVPQGLRSVREDLEKNFRTILKSGLGRLDLVTREEFEVQEGVLRRTRAKLEALEARLADIEARGPKPAAARKTGAAGGKKAPRKKAPKKA
ncbi:MAG: accessory factor UbiK family protein [Gammaproteobacteria bacterium]|nr:accessory factor UbiK family protein [Gammaproteobacteria bacterium]MDH4253718.1 accessory factor UbiK family protein [Gammaproteobacteria bacterium]MDH5309647.1 accessory factor UbiK family protein [Gammaproteobacteria bacterium]